MIWYNDKGEMAKRAQREKYDMDKKSILLSGEWLIDHFNFGCGAVRAALYRPKNREIASKCRRLLKIDSIIDCHFIPFCVLYICMCTYLLWPQSAINSTTTHQPISLFRIGKSVDFLPVFRPFAQTRNSICLKICIDSFVHIIMNKFSEFSLWSRHNIVAVTSGYVTNAKFRKCYCMIKVKLNDRPSNISLSP